MSIYFRDRTLVGFFDKYTIGYIFIFIISIFLSFGLIAEPNPKAIKVSLSLATTCLLFLIPYFLSFREKLNLESLILQLRKKAEKQLQLNPGKEPDEVTIIDNLIMNAFFLKDDYTLDRGLESLANLALKAAEQRKWDERTELEKSNLALLGIVNIGLATVEDPLAPFGVIMALGYVGLEGAKQSLGHIMESASRYLKEISVKATETHGIYREGWLYLSD